MNGARSCPSKQRIRKLVNVPRVRYHSAHSLATTISQFSGSG